MRPPPDGSVESRHGPRALAVAILGIAAALLPVVGVALPVNPSFLPVVLAAVVLTAAVTTRLLMLQFRQFGRMRLLVAAQAFWWTVVTQAVAALTIPGLVTVDPLLGGRDSSAWLLVVWHVAVPGFLASAFLPWPGSWVRVVPEARRRRVARNVMLTSFLLVAAVSAVCVVGESALPDVVAADLVGYAALVPAVAPWLTLIAGAAFVVTWFRSDGTIDRWFIPSAAAVLADSLLTFLAGERFTVGWYAGTALAVVGSAVVLGALLGDMDAAYGREHAAAQRLRDALHRADEAENRLRGALDASPDGFALLDIDRSGPAGPEAVRVLTMNAAFAGLLPDQRPPSGIVPLVSLDLPLDLAALTRQVAEAVAASTAISRVYFMPGEQAGEEMVGRAVVSPSGSGAVLAWRDETTSHQANEALHAALRQARRARRALRDALDAADEGFAVLAAVPGPDGIVDAFTVSFVNQSGAAMLGTTPRRLEDADLGEVIPAALAPGVLDLMRSCLADGLPEVGTLPLPGDGPVSMPGSHDDDAARLRVRLARLSERELVATFRPVVAREPQSVVLERS